MEKDILTFRCIRFLYSLLKRLDLGKHLKIGQKDGQVALRHNMSPPHSNLEEVENCPDPPPNNKDGIFLLDLACSPS